MVLDVQPCGDVAEGSEVTLFYQASAGAGGLPTTEPSDEAGNESPGTGNSSAPAGVKPSCSPPAQPVGNQCVKVG